MRQQQTISDVIFSLFIEQLEYDDGPAAQSLEDVINNMYQGRGQAEGIPELRDQYSADLVQLMGVFPENCGIG